MSISNDPEFLTLVFATAGGLAVTYYVVYQALVRLRIRALGLVHGAQRVTLSNGSACDIEFKPHRGSGSWDLAIRVTSMQSRDYRIPLPIPDGGPFATLDKETHEFGRQAFEIGMDWIRQEDKLLEIGSRSFRPIKHGHTGFVDRLGIGLEKVDWKLSCAEGEHTLHEIARNKDFGPRAFALIAAMGALFFAWVEPVLNRGAVVLEPLPAYTAAIAIAVFVFCSRFATLRGRYQALKRRPPFLGDCFWPAFAVGALVLIPIQHLNVKLDSSAPRVVMTQVTAKRTVQGMASLSYMIQVKKTDGKGSWVIELSREDYLAATLGGTLVNLKFHSGAFGMEWLERATLDDIDRSVAGTPVYEAPPPPLGK